MRRDTLIQLGAGAVLAGSLALSSGLGLSLTNSAGRHKLTYVVRAEDNDPPQVGLGIAMGAFRGLFVNILWIRANKLKEEGKYYEAMDLSTTITRLQPRFPPVWSFHAWNMAYNISVTTQTPAERWNWVQSGIRLLRDEGIVWNPNDLAIHRELGWIYLHKIAGYTDDGNTYYKRQVAIEWTELLGTPPAPRPMEDRAAAIARYVEWLSPIDRAPDRLEDVIKNDPLVGELARRLREEVGEEFGTPLLKRYQQQVVLDSSVRRDVIEAGFGPKSKAMAALMRDAGFAKAWPALLAHLRRRVIIDEYHMEPSRMIRYTEKFGPMDWRHAASHAVYWVQRGVEGAMTRVTDRNRKDFDFVNADRQIIHAVQELFRSGELYFDYTGAVTNPGNPVPLYLAGPAPFFVETYREVLDELRARGGIFEDTDERVYTIYSAGYENFMKDAIRFYYRRGQKELATRYKNELGQWEHQNANDSSRASYFAKPIDEFIQEELKEERIRSPYVAVQEVVAALQGAYVAGLLQGNDELFRSQMDYAKLTHGYFMTMQLRTTSLNPAEERMAQMPKDFREIAGVVFSGVMGMLDRDDAERVFSAAPEDLRVFAYDVLADKFRAAIDEEAKAGGRPFAVAFPEPPGMAAHRVWEEQRAKEAAETQLDVQQR